MPEYLAPGVFVEEVSFRAKSIEGVTTSTAGFVGPTRYGPITPALITSLTEFEQHYGDGQALAFSDAAHFTHFLWHAARAYFAEGGKRLYVGRVFRPWNGTLYAPPPATLAADLPPTGGPYADGHARTRIGSGVVLRARHPGAAGGLPVRLSFRYASNSLGTGGGVVAGLQRGDLALIDERSGGQGRLCQASLGSGNQWRFTDLNGVLTALTDLDPARQRLRRLLVDLAVQGKPPCVGLSLNADAGLLANDPYRPIDLLTSATGGLGLVRLLAAETPGLLAGLQAPEIAGAVLAVECTLSGGNDGARPRTADHAAGLRAFEAIADIASVAAPGVTFGYESGQAGNAQAVIKLLLEHCRTRYRIAVIDCGNAQNVNQVRAMRAQFDSSYTALYYPWVIVRDALSGQELALPPSGFVAGIYARNDIERAVFKAPANEVVHSAIRFELMLNTAQQEVLNPEGINCFRFFAGRGLRLWGARTMSADPEWKYVNLRRHFNYLEHSIDKGTQWAVFEPNGERLWANLRQIIADFLFNEWKNGALLGETPDKAFFVKCDRSTMTQNDLDNGRLICLIGVAPIKPAEFVIFRIGQWTADAKT